MTTPLIDAHAHFLHEACGRADWREVNAARFRAGDVHTGLLQQVVAGQ